MQRRNYGLDLIRGLAATGIALYHFLAWNHGLVLHSLGTFGVYLFFVLSAVTMMMRYETDFGRALTAEGLAAFYRNRVARLFPLLAIVSVLSAQWSVSQGESMLNQGLRTLLTATSAMGLHLPGYLSNATGAWSLGIEAVFYTVFPAVALLASAGKIRHLVVATIVLLLFQQSTLILISELPEQQFWSYYITPVVFAPFFAIGLLIFKAPLPSRPWFIWISLTLLMLVAAYTQLFPVTLWYDPAHYLVVTAISAASVAFAYRGEVPRVMRRLAVFLGNISYALYLTHWFAHRLAGMLIADFGWPEAWRPAIFAGSAIVIAWATFQFFERPARGLLKSKRVAAAPDAEDT